MIETKIKYTKDLEPYSLSRAKEKYINEDIKEKQNKEHTQLTLNEEFAGYYEEVKEIAKKTFTNIYCIFFHNYKVENEIIQIIIANEKITGDSEEFKIFQTKLNELLEEKKKNKEIKKENDDEIDINSQITGNQENVEDNINQILENKQKKSEKTKEPKKENLSWDEISELPPDQRLAKLPLLIKPESAEELTKNKVIIEKIKVELETLERYQYKLSNNSYIMALVFYLMKEWQGNNSENKTIALEMPKNEYSELYNKFQELTKEDIPLEPSHIAYFHLNEKNNIERKKKILEFDKNIEKPDEFYELQLKIIKAKISSLDYLFSLTDYKNKEIVKFKKAKIKQKIKIPDKFQWKKTEKQEVYQIFLNKKQLDRIITWNLLGLENIRLGEKK